MKNNIALIGMPGSGKTTIGKILARRIKKKFIDLDRLIEKNSKMSINEIFEKFGEPFFRELENNCLIEALNKQNIVLSTGGGIVTNDENMKLLKEKAIIFYIKRELDIIIKNVNFNNRPLLKDKNNLYRLYEKRYFLYEKYCDYTIINDGTLYDAVDKIEKILQEV